ncbi:MAG: putative selenate reductase subunit YgfK [Candidatus Cloacimonadales bacterium]|nr:putative selenate reductase subunit YgfK [Candidatus Cloacimonadales bacterium]
MSDIMIPVKFKKLLYWILEEYKKEKTIFGIHEDKFYRKPDQSYFTIFGEKCETAMGPAAGPHTQQTPNIVAAYLTGCRFFELKTVQIMDELDIEKPCIEATDEGYNTEWSTELTVPQAYNEYVKAWFLLPVLNKMFGLSQLDERAFIFNMSVGYDLKGIKSSKIDGFIEGLKDASRHPDFLECKAELKEAIATGDIPGITDPEFVETISPHISNSITLSTMHGCPPEDQEAICKYLMKEKKLHTFLKMNPTLHGYEYVKNAFAKLGFGHITLKEESFTHDMQYEAALQMLDILIPFAKENGVEFGAKLSNTLAVLNDKGMLPTDEMYMSGRALYPLTINLAKKLSHQFNGELKISYAGGANFFNAKQLFESGIRPITIATDVLKPGGYTKFTQMSKLLDESMTKPTPAKIDLYKLDDLAKDALEGDRFRYQAKNQEPMYINKKLGRLDCFVAPCEEACPIHQDIPEYIRLIGEKRYPEAFELILSKNPLPHITGYICDHKCMLKCVRNDYEEPVLIRELKRIAAEKGYKKYFDKMEENFRSLQKLRKFDIKIAVIGAGPAGLSSAYFLARQGFDVTVFDKTDKPGGTVIHTIPGFRIPSWAIDNDIELIKCMGVKFEMYTDGKIDVVDLKVKGFKYINLAIGAGKSRTLPLEGDTSKVFGVIKFLQDWHKDPKAVNLGKNVAVVGGGNSAMDGARAARKTPGVENVYIIYRRTIKEMPADREELNHAVKDGVIFKELINPVSYNNGMLKCQVMELGEQDASGRKRPVPVAGKLVELAVDSVLSAIGEMVDFDLLKANNISIDERGKIPVNEFLETSVENVFIAGDAFRGPSTVVESIADGQAVANGILKKEGIDLNRVNPEDYEFDYAARIKEIRQKKGVIKPTVEVLSNEAEIAAETQRCLECNFICNKCMEVCPNRANLALKVPGFKNENQILHLDGFCNECGNCATFCPYDGAPYKDKFTLYWNDEDMLVNGNDGFLLVSEDNEITLKVRINKKFYEVCFNKSGKLLSCHSEHEIEQKTEFDALLNIIWWTYKNQNYLFV